MSVVTGLAIILTASTAVPSAPLPHAQEIKLFASTVAIARIARDECPGFTINEEYLEGMRQRLHIIRADQSAFVPKAHAVVEALHKALSEATSREAWCGAVFRLYGPDGTMDPRLAAAVGLRIRHPGCHAIHSRARRRDGHPDPFGDRARR